MSDKLCFIFPGQGSQSVGMGKELHAHYTAAREVFEEVDEALGEKLSQLMFDGDSDELTRTANAQPALMAVSLAVVRTLQSQGFDLTARGVAFAGHSLGEYSAYAAAEALTLSDTARLLRRRGSAMQAACAEGAGAMAAILGGSIEQAREFAKQATAETSGDAICCVANDNAPGQAVLSGHKAAVEKAITLAQAAGIKRCVLLPVSAPFHCVLMQPAAEVMAEALAEVPMQAPSLPIIANVTADAVTDPQAARRLLVEQVTAPVRWRESVPRLKALGAMRAIECGVGKVLSGLIKRIDGDMACVNLHTPQEIDDFLQAL